MSEDSEFVPEQAQLDEGTQPSPSADAALTVVAAALRVGDLILSAPPPARHHTLMHAMHHLGWGSQVPFQDQGFLLDDGTFCQRERALRIAIAAGQLVKNPHAQSSPIAPPDLYSEDLW